MQLKCSSQPTMAAAGVLTGSRGRFEAAREASDDGLPDVEQRMADFTELIGVAVANAQSRAELIASRARIVAASDEARRRIERDLHDGAQQRLIALALRLRMAADSTAGSEPIRRDIGALVREVGPVKQPLCRASAHAASKSPVCPCTRLLASVPNTEAAEAHSITIGDAAKRLCARWSPESFGWVGSGIQLVNNSPKVCRINALRDWMRHTAIRAMWERVE
jgi:hypothetical protein